MLQSSARSDSPAGAAGDKGGGTRANEKRGAIVAVAREIFLEKGFADASMSEIAARVGGSKGTLYNYFPSKEALFAAVMEVVKERHMARLFSWSIGDGDLRETLYGVAHDYLTFLVTDDALAIHRVVIGEAGRFPELGKMFYETGPRRGLDRLSAAFSREMKAGTLREADPEMMAQQFLGLCNSGLYQFCLWNVAPPPDDSVVTDFAHHAVDTFLAAFGPRD